MPQANQFRHQAYSTNAPGAPHYLVRPGSYPPFGSESFRQRMKVVGRTLRRSGVRAIYLVHGTYAGFDAFGVLSELSRVLPGAASAFGRAAKRMVDRMINDVGNYTPHFAQEFDSAINSEQPGPEIPVRLFHWSSENHHLGRADGAVRLLDDLCDEDWSREDRVLLWGHSHAGNVFALLTNLLGADRQVREEFFSAADIYYRWPVVGCVDIPIWHRVREMLAREDHPLNAATLDLVTFGTPIRYGWDSGGYDRLLHFIHHRPAEGLPEYRAAFPPRLYDVMHATEGDYVQQLGIAGTNVAPSVLAWRSWLADRRLNRLLQGKLPSSGPVERFHAGRIVPDEGTSLLVDYKMPHGGVGRHLAGHAVYTDPEWLLFHAEEVVRRIYTPEACKAA